MLYDVRAADALANVQVVQLEAPDLEAARAMAIRQRLTPLSISPSHRLSRSRRDAFNLPLFAEELAMLLDAGLPVVEAIDGLAERQSTPSAQAVLAGLAKALRSGDRLSTAMTRYPVAFPELFIGIVRAAERTSSLSGSLAKYVAYDAHVRALRERLGSAAIYPGILLLFGSAVTLFLLTYVVPRFAAVYQSSGRPLPLVSQTLMDLGLVLSRNATLLSVALLAAVLLAVHWLRGRDRELGWTQLLSLLPGAAAKLRIIESARLYRTLGMLLEGGLPIRESLALATSVVFGDRRGSLTAVSHAIEGGRTLSASLNDVGLCTPLALRLLQVGERSGQLGSMLQRTAAFHEHETALWIERFSRIVGPALMVLISLIVGVVVIFLYIPVFDLAGSLQ